MDGKIDSAIHLRIDIDQPLADGCGGRSESLDEGFNHPSLVVSVVINGGVGVLANLLHELLPDGLLNNGKRLYFEVEVVRLPIASPPSSRLEQIGKLGNRENSPTVISLHRF